MVGALTEIITSTDPAARNQSLDAVCRTASREQLLAACAELDAFRRRSDNLYERVRALFFLYAIHRFHLPLKPGIRTARPRFPSTAYKHLLNRRFEEAIDAFLAVQKAEGPGDPISSALAAAYHRLAFQTLADQVRRSVRSVRGNQWMFRMGHPADHPLRLRPRTAAARRRTAPIPSCANARRCAWTSRHSGWSDIFFLGMDFPEGARVLNVSIDLGVHGRDAAPRPPVEAYLRVIDEPVLRLTSVDLGATADITSLAEVFDFAKDYLGLLKAAVIAGGHRAAGHRRFGPEPGGPARPRGRPGPRPGTRQQRQRHPQRLAPRRFHQPAGLADFRFACGPPARPARCTGALQEDERRLVLARAILGEWLGGSGGGWQDSGGVWPGIKLIEGVLAGEGDPEFGISRGRLMPQHTHPGCRTKRRPQTRRQLQDSLVLVHGGMAQNVGPILEMVTEKYLLRSDAEWQARRACHGHPGRNPCRACGAATCAALGGATTRNFFGPIQTIIPWASNLFTETLIQRVQGEFGKQLLGLLDARRHVRRRHGLHL